MAAEFAAYSLSCGPVGSSPWIGEIIAEGQRLPMVFRGTSEVGLLENMRAFWEAEVVKAHGSLAAREKRLAQLAPARANRKDRPRPRRVRP